MIDRDGDLLVHLFTIGPSELYDLGLALDVLLTLEEYCGNDVLILAHKEGD